MVVVGSIITQAFFKVVARRINGDFVFVITKVAAAALLVDGMQNMEELADAGHFVGIRKGMSTSESGFDKP